MTQSRRAIAAGALPAACALAAASLVIVRGGIAVGLSATVALGTGLVVGLRVGPPPGRRGALALLVPVQLWLAAVIWHGWVQLIAAAAIGCTIGLLFAKPSADRRRGTLGVALAGLASLFAIAWSGANDPAAAWFGSTISHGDRSRAAVALTFDDGPNDSATLQVAAILDDRGARGTFFLVGRAVEERPEIVRTLVAGGHVVGNHSHRHGDHDWLAPRYPEFERGERSFAGVLGQCPAFFRPPHGQHTPLMARQVRRLGATTVTWDVIADDWRTTDAHLIADRVLRGVRPGSIVLLHDGLDGDPSVDRTVLVDALPLILDGLRDRGLEAVGLDELLGQSAWLPNCPT